MDGVPQLLLPLLPLLLCVAAVSSLFLQSALPPLTLVVRTSYDTLDFGYATRARYVRYKESYDQWEEASDIIQIFNRATSPIPKKIIYANHKYSGAFWKTTKPAHITHVETLSF
jgi:hypothetical protein